MISNSERNIINVMNTIAETKQCRCSMVMKKNSYRQARCNPEKKSTRNKMRAQKRQVQTKDLPKEKLRNEDLKCVLAKRGLHFHDKESKANILRHVTKEDVFEGIGRKFSISNPCSSSNWDDDLQDIFSASDVVDQKMKQDFSDRGSLTNVTSLKISFENPKNADVIDCFFTVSYPEKISLASHIADYRNFMVEKMRQRIDAYEGRGSGLVYRGIHSIELKNTKYNPARARGYLPLPKHLSATKAYLNIRNKNEFCFKYALMALIHPQEKHAERAKQYEKYFNEVDWSHLNFPFELEKNLGNVQKFEEANPSLPPLFIHQHADCGNQTSIELVYSSIKSIDEPNSVINLLFYTNDQSESHIVPIRHMSRALFHLTNKKTKAQYICPKGYFFSSTLKLWKEHDKYCQNTESTVKIQMPKNACAAHKSSGIDKHCPECVNANKILFKDYNTQQNHPVTIYGDTESLNVKVSKCRDCGTTTKASEKHLSPSGKECNSRCIIETIQQVEAFGLHSVIADEYKDIFPKLDLYLYKSERARDVHINFMKKIKHYVTKVQKIIEETNVVHNGYTLPFSKKECHICLGSLTENEGVIEHDHLTGKIRGFAHDTCNFKYTFNGKPIPVIFHNWKKYDCKMLMEAFAKEDDVTLQPIAENSENFKTVSARWPCMVQKLNAGKVKSKKIDIKVQFIDSFAHLSTSLEVLVENLKKTGSNQRLIFKQLSDQFPDDNQFELLLRKGVFPYEWFDIFSKHHELRLPPREAFYSQLKNESISEEDYQHALNVWRVFKVKSFEEYHDLYLKTDILLLADVCEAHKQLAMKWYGLNPFWYITTPSFAWRAMLKNTNVQLESLLDVDMYNFMIKAKRGGISYCAKKYAKANNPNIIDYDKTKPTTHILYIDANNLYGHSMSQPLPSGGFEWVEQSKYETIIHKLEMNEPCEQTGYFLEVDLKLPQNKHFEHSDFPLCPEHMKPPCEMHSKTGNSKNCTDCRKKNIKLVNHCWNHLNYVIDSSYLKVALQHGIKITKVHKVLKYNQSRWMKPYIDFNTEKRNLAPNEFEKNFFKLMNNSVYGGTLLQAEKFVHFKIATSKKKYQNIHRFPSKIKNEHYYHRCVSCNPSMFDEEGVEMCECLVGIEQARQRCTITRPVFVGVKILELSKALMGGVWYQLKNHFGKRIKLIMTDTDAFMFQLETEDINREFFEKFQDILDLSNSNFDGSPLPQDMDLDKNKKVLGKMKNEVPPCQFSTRALDNGVSVYKHIDIDEVIALRSKCYAFKLNYQAFNVVTPFLESQTPEFNKDTMRKLKGVTKARMKDVTYDDYQNVLETGDPHVVNECSIRSKRQKLMLVTFQKQALCREDDKRIPLEDGVNTIPYGYDYDGERDT